MFAIGMIFLNFVLVASKHAGMYLSNKMFRFAFSDCTFLVSVQLLTYLASDKLKLKSIFLNSSDEMVIKQISNDSFLTTLHRHR